MNSTNLKSTEFNVEEIAKKMSQEEVDKLQAFFDGKRKLDADELIFDSKGLLVLNKLVEIGRIKLPVSSDEKPGFHAFWSSWNHQENNQTLNTLHFK